MLILKILYSPLSPRRAGTRINISGICLNTISCLTLSRRQPAVTIPKPAIRNGNVISRNNDQNESKRESLMSFACHKRHMRHATWLQLSYFCKCWKYSNFFCLTNYEICRRVKTVRGFRVTVVVTVVNVGHVCFIWFLCMKFLDVRVDYDSVFASFLGLKKKLFCRKTLFVASFSVTLFFVEPKCTYYMIG